MGWRDIDEYLGSKKTPGAAYKGKSLPTSDVLEYLYNWVEDLDAAWDAEQMLLLDTDSYINELSIILERDFKGDWHGLTTTQILYQFTHATAAQKIEAVLKVKDKWQKKE